MLTANGLEALFPAAFAPTQDFCLVSSPMLYGGTWAVVGYRKTLCKQDDSQCIVKRQSVPGCEIVIWHVCPNREIVIFSIVPGCDFAMFTQCKKHSFATWAIVLNIKYDNSVVVPGCDFAMFTQCKKHSFATWAIVLNIKYDNSVVVPGCDFAMFTQCKKSTIVWSCRVGTF